jgi:hypothetical protein
VADSIGLLRELTFKLLRSIYGQSCLIHIFIVENKDGKRPRVTTVFRAAQTPLGEIGEDMIEQERLSGHTYHIPKPSPRTVKEVSL